MNNKIIIKVTGNINRFIKKCIEYHLNLSDINYLNNDELTCNININDFKEIKRLNYYSKIKIINYLGINGIKIHFKKYLYAYLLFLFCFILMDICTSYIVKIDVIHENKKVRELVERELNDHGIKKYSLAYSFDELEKIKESILNDNPNTLEWMSITKVGMTYVVRIEERIIKEEEKESLPRNIIAKKDALITKVIVTHGEPLVRSGDYVKKGDILISGQIHLYEEVKGNVASTGTIYGNVWYEAEIKVPLKREEIIDTGKKRYNLNINNKIFLKNKYPLFRQENIKELNILGIKIKIYKEVEYTKKEVKLNEKEQDLYMEKKLKEAFNKKLKNTGTIINQKVLKKEQNNSTIDYRIFVVTNEIISEYSYYELGDENDTTKSN